MIPIPVHEQKSNVITIICILIIFLPLLDLLTAFTEHWPLSIGKIVRMIAIIPLYGWLSFKLYTSNRFQFVYLQLMLFLFFGSFLMNWYIKTPFFFMEEAAFLAKTIYGVVLLFTVLALLQSYKIRSLPILQASSVAAIITGSSYWIAIISGTSLASYPYVKSGFTGWFYAANELSAILIIFLALTLSYYHFQTGALAWTALIFILSMLPMIGTKTAMYGGGLILGFYSLIAIVRLLAKFNRIQSWRKSALIVALFIVYILLLPVTPAYTNSNQEKKFIGTTENVQHTEIKQHLLSSRDIYLKETRRAFTNAPLSQKLLGLGYGGIYSRAPKMIEMDGYDLLFSYGAIGFISYVGLAFLLGWRMIRFNSNTGYLLLLTCLIACGGISFIAGHVLFAPAVMSYIAILMLVTGLLSKRSISDIHWRGMK